MFESNNSKLLDFLGRKQSEWKKDAKKDIVHRQQTP